MAVPSLFQSTRPHGARRLFDTADITAVMFQSTRPHGARPSVPAVIRVDKVSIHAPAWGATSPPNLSPGVYMFQSTRPHGARLIGRPLFDFFLVSIHAPAWGATSNATVISTSGTVSIHAPAWGATYAMFEYQNGFRFQSTRPHGARRIAEALFWVFYSFNPRARMGRDLSPDR